MQTQVLLEEAIYYPELAVQLQLEFFAVRLRLRLLQRLVYRLAHRQELLSDRCHALRRHVFLHAQVDSLRRGEEASASLDIDPLFKTGKSDGVAPRRLNLQVHLLDELAGLRVLGGHEECACLERCLWELVVVVCEGCILVGGGLPTLFKRFNH